MNLNIEGLIPILGGIFALLAVHGKIVISKDPVKIEEWKKTWKPKINWLGPLVIIFGLLQLFRV